MAHKSSMLKKLLESQKKKLTVEEINDLHQEFTTDDHAIPLEDLCHKLETDIETGLSEEVAQERLKDHPNALTPPKVTPEYINLLRCMFSGFAALLWTCSFLCFIIFGITKFMDDVADEGIEWFGVIIIVICVVSGLFAFIQESRNSRIMESFSKLVPSYALVVRNGEKKRVATEELALGDLVHIKMGDKIPADIRIITCVGLRVENSSLTGESAPVPRTDVPTDPNPLESRNMAFFSSFAVAGQGTGIVIATGDNTMIGRLAGLTANVGKTATPIAKEIQNFCKIVTIIAIICGLIFFVLSLALESNLVVAFTYLLGIIIANVPEVLLVTVTTSLTLTAKKMADKNCLVRNLEAVETLGSTSTICSDKTGTLTQNKMTVSNLWFGSVRHHMTPGLWSLGAERNLLLDKPAFKELMKAATLCLRAEFRHELETYSKIEDRDVIGDASETGILKFCEQIYPTKKFRVMHVKIAEEPFSSITKYHISVHKDVENLNVYIKGAPEVIIDFCTDILDMDGETRNLTTADILKVRQACTELGFLGERVLAYCDLRLPTDNFPLDYQFNANSDLTSTLPKTGYRFLGLISLLDPPRPSVPEAVHKCRSAGIKVIMVTGDHPVTAMAIAKSVGIVHEEPESYFDGNPDVEESPNPLGSSQAIIVTGSELRHMASHELDNIIQHYEEIVFARTSPQQKLLIVESCQRLGEIVAVTGDGVNDSPALRKADIGVAMGIAGSDVAKNSADMVLLDDNFASIVTGIEEGRLIFDNLKKSIAYTLTSSIPEMVPMLTSIVLAIPLPFVIELIICIDIGTDLLPAIAFAYESAESDIMKRPPRNPQYDRLVNKRLISIAYGQIGMTQAFAGFINYFMILACHGFMPDILIGLRSDWDNRTINDLTDSFGQTWTYSNRMELLNEARTGYFVAIVLTQMIDLFMCKTRRNSIFQQGLGNWFLNMAFIFEMVLIVALLYTPGIGMVLKTRPLDPYWFWPPLPLGLFLWVYDEFRRYCIRNYPGGIIDRETYY